MNVEHRALPVPSASPHSLERAYQAAVALGGREILRFFRQRNRVVGALGQPILFWLLFGAGLSQWFKAGDQSFQDYFFPGTLVLIVLFTAIFSTISIIEDRREGFLQSVLVAPIPRVAMVAGKIGGGALIAVSQGVVFLVLGRLSGVTLDVGAMFLAVAWLLVGAVALTGLGFVIAWRLDSTQGFHAIMNLLLMPLWLLSGAFFPVPTVAADAALGTQILHWVMRVNPVTYLVAGLRQVLQPDIAAIISHDAAEIGRLWMPTMSTCWLVSLLATAVALWGAWRIAEGRSTGDLL